MSLALYFQLSAFAFGTILGSFLNVVIHRLPTMFHNEFKKACKEYFCEQSEIALDGKNNIGDEPADSDPADSSGEKPKSEAYNLIYPPSHCPGCNNRVKIIDNIPLLSYLLLKGKCRHCATKIPLRYPLVEFSAGLLAMLCVYKFGVSWQALAATALCLALLTLSVIDLREQLLPDDITIPFVWIGLAVNIFGLFTQLHDAVIGAIVGYMILWTVFQLFLLLTGKEGMGYGDFKLLALIGAWFGWQSLTVVILIASISGLFLGIYFTLFKNDEENSDESVRFPFGPSLALAALIVLFFPELMYFNL